MAGNPKFLITEQNGIDFDYYQEYVPQAVDVTFDPTGTQLTATDLQEATKEAANTGYSALVLPRYSLILVHNSTISNGQAIRWSSLTNDAPVVIPKKSQVAEIIFSNSNTSADADFRFYRNSVSAGNLFFTWTAIRNNQTKVASAPTDFTSPIFNAGDLLEIRFDDQGTNPQDLVMAIFMQTVE